MARSKKNIHQHTTMLTILHEVPYSLQQGDEHLRLCVCHHAEKNEYTTHMLNKQDGGLYYGRYFTEKDNALKSLVKRMTANYDITPAGVKKTKGGVHA